MKLGLAVAMLLLVGSPVWAGPLGAVRTPAASPAPRDLGCAGKLESLQGSAKLSLSSATKKPKKSAPCQIGAEVAMLDFSASCEWAVGGITTSVKPTPSTAANCACGGCADELSMMSADATVTAPSISELRLGLPSNAGARSGNGRTALGAGGRTVSFGSFTMNVGAGAGAGAGPGVAGGGSVGAGGSGANGATGTTGPASVEGWIQP